jgi:peptide-methionine (S)-S-oxide reductase
LYQYYISLILFSDIIRYGINSDVIWKKAYLQSDPYCVYMSEEKTNVQANTKTANLQLATYAAGCFWGVEEAFRQVKGVKSAMVGYTGGSFDNPTYKDVCKDKTGHAEAIQVQFDPNEVSYEDLLSVFWSVHDPTTKNRQGPDIGSQYRSMIAYHTQEQELLAKKSKEDLERSGKFNGRRIVTEIVPASTFYKAEEYHQKYYQKSGKAGGTCYL